ncbi:uncharacterized protein C4orf50 homolog [Pleurodeles waltl]|uniref:uncharacterized protein C4orf50 homolog n=1 Tax=Pleurodeles waltl TaxID=8319 RepID=UPI003709C38A
MPGLLQLDSDDVESMEGIKELELSEKKLLERVEQMTGDMHFLENVNVRIKCRLQDIQVELQEANEGKEKLERTHKEKVRRLQDHLRMKEGEIKSYLEYFEHYKDKRRQQMRMLREREHRLQNQVLKLEKEIVDCNAMPPFLNTVEDPSNDEGVEQSIETDTFQNHTRLPGTEEEREEAKIYNEDGAHHLTKQIQKLQNDLKSLLEREVVNNGEREELINRLQKSEDNEDFLNRKLEEFRCRISELKMTEYNLQQFVEDLEEENKRLKNELKVSSHKEEENPHLVAEECKMHNIPDINLVNHSSATGKQKTTNDVESKDRTSREKEFLLGLFEKLGLRSKDVLQNNGAVFKELQSLVQTMQALKLQSEVAKSQSVFLEKERHTIQQDYQKIVGDFEGLQLALDKTCCEYMPRVVELQQSATRNTHLESLFDYLSEAVQIIAVKHTEILALKPTNNNPSSFCQTILSFNKYEGVLPGTGSASQQDISAMISATYNQLNHGKMLLSSFEKPGMPDQLEYPTKEPKEDIVQEAITHPPHSILSSEETAYGSENYSSFNSCVIPLAINTVGVHSTTTTYSTTKTKWLKDNQEALKPDSADLFYVPLKDSIGALEIEIERLQAEKKEQKKLQEIKEKLLFQASMEKRLLQEALQESNTLLHMWASKSEQYWREPYFRHSQENNGVHEQQPKMSITTEPMNVRHETKKEKDHCLQGLYMPQNRRMTISQQMSAIEKEKGICFPVTEHHDEKRGQNQDLVHSEKGTLEFTTISNIVSETEVRSVQWHTEKNDCRSDCNMTKENSDEWSQMWSTVQTNLHPHNQELKSHEGCHTKKRLSPEKEKSKLLNIVWNIEQQNPEYISKLSLNDELDTCLLRCSLDEQFDRYHQQTLSLHGEKDSEGQKVQPHEKSDSKSMPDDLQYSFSKILCTLKKEIDLISHKVEVVEQEKQSYFDKIHSLEEACSKARQEIMELQEEKLKYFEKVFVLEREKEKYAQQVQLLEQENRDSSKQINLITDCRSKICHLEEENKNYSQKICALMTEVTDCSQNLLQLQKENENYCQKICLLEDEKKRNCEFLCELKEKADLYFQKISTLEQDNARYSLQMCMVKQENSILYEKLNSIEEEIDRYSQKIIGSYETYSEYNSVLSRPMNATSKGSNKHDYPIEVESILSSSNVCFNNNTSSQAQNDNSTEYSKTANKSDGLDREKMSQKLISLEQKKCTFFQLISDLGEERKNHSQRISELLHDKEKYLKKVYNMEEENIKVSEKNDVLDAEKQTLLGHVNNLKTEKEEHLKEIFKIKEEYAKSRQMLAQQQKDNTKLRNKIHKVRKEASDEVVASKEAMYSIISENKDLKELVLHLKGNYENVIKETMLGMEEIIKGLETENESLLNRIHQMETETALEISKQVEQILKEREQLINTIGELELMDEDEARSKENAGYILNPSDNENVLSQDSFVAGEANKVVSMQQAHAGFANNSKREIDYEIIDKELDKETNLAFRELKVISEDHNDSEMANLDGQPFNKVTPCSVSECCGLLLTPLDQQHISAKVK